MADKDLTKFALIATRVKGVNDTKKPQKVKFENSEPRKQDSNELQGNNHSPDFVGLLKNELKAPFLGLLEEYVKRTSPNKASKDLGRTIYFYKQNNPRIYKCCLYLDFAFNLIFIIIVIAVALRGLNINPILFFKEISSLFSN